MHNPAGLMCVGSALEGPLGHIEALEKHYVSEVVADFPGAFRRRSSSPSTTPKSRWRQVA